MFRDIWNRCSRNTLTATKMMWKHGGNSDYCTHRMQACAELSHSQNAVTRRGLSTSFLILARCVFVPQIAIYTTKTLAPKGGLNYSKVVIRKQWKSRNRRSQTADAPPAQDGTDGTSGYLIPKTSRNLSDSIKNREQRQKAAMSEQGFSCFRHWDTQNSRLGSHIDQII